jgi:hypothetical protein
VPMDEDHTTKFFCCRGWSKRGGLLRAFMIRNWKNTRLLKKKKRCWKLKILENTRLLKKKKGLEAENFIVCDLLVLKALCSLNM